jgi:hypothetical protein
VLEIAFGYNEEQHYHWPNFTNQSYKEFISQVRGDQLEIKYVNMWEFI